jgi:hypothetical protein
MTDKFEKVFDRTPEDALRAIERGVNRVTLRCSNPVRLKSMLLRVLEYADESQCNVGFNVTIDGIIMNVTQE